MKKVIILTENELLYTKGICTLFAGGKKELNECRKNGHIPDLFSCDPDYIRTPESDGRIPFVEYEKGNIHYGIVPDYVDGNEYENELEMLSLFLSDNYKEHFDGEVPNSWDYFDSHSNGIAFRGGKGYVYSIWDLKTTV